MEGEPYIDEQDRLVEEACVLFGMIDEVRAKAALLLAKVRTMQISSHYDEDFAAQAELKVRRFHSDLRKYDGRLGEIGQILKEQYGLDVV